MRVAERLRMRTHSRRGGVSHVRPTMRPADQRATSGCGRVGRPPGPHRVRARVLRRTTPGCLAPVAWILACVIVVLSVTLPVCAEALAHGTEDRLASAALPSRVEAAGGHETCQCDRCGLCRWYQLPFVAGIVATLASSPTVILPAAVADRALTVGTLSEQPGRSPPDPSRS